MTKLAHRLKPEVSLPMPSNYYTESPEASDVRFPASSTQEPYLPPSGNSRDSDSSPVPPSNPTHSTAMSMNLVSSPVPILSSTESEFYDDDSDSDFDEAGFDHPSTYLDQPWIWIPKDELGLSQQLVGELRRGGVDASDEGAYIESSGNVEVTRNPPDEAWIGGQNV